MEFNIDFGNVAAPAPVDDRHGPLFAAAPGVLLPLGGDEVLFRLRADGSQHVMTRQVFEALARSSAFRGLDRHAAEIARSLPGLAGREAAVRAVLDSLVARGLLLSADDWLSTLRDGALPPPASRVLALRAGGDPTALARALDAAANAAGPPPRILLFDDAGGAAAGEALARCRARAPGLVVVDAARRRALVERFARAVPAAAPLLARLFGADAAGARNLAVLLGAGAQVTWLDGRVGLPVHQAPDLEPGIDLAGAQAMPARFHPRAAEALAAGTPLPGDALAMIGAGCGLGVGTLCAPDGAWPVARADLHGLEPAALAHLGPDSRVAAVVLGQRGAAREPGREWLFLMDAGSRERFWSDRELYLRTLDQPCVWHGPARARLLARTLEAPCALDAGAMLPPAFGDAPAGDAFWGLLLSALRPRDVVLHAPWSLAAPQPALAREAGGWLAETPGLGGLLTDLLAPRCADLRAADPAPRLAAIAAMLSDLAAAPAAVRADLLAEYLGFCRADLVARLQSAFVAAQGAPLHWQADVRALVEANGRALTAGAPPRLAGWPDTLDAPACAARFATELEAIAGALAAWPALWQHALDRGAALADG